MTHNEHRKLDGYQMFRDYEFIEVGLNQLADMLKVGIYLQFDESTYSCYRWGVSSLPVPLIPPFTSCTKLSECWTTENVVICYGAI